MHLISKDIWPYQRYDQTQNNRYSENKRRIHAIKLQVEKDQKNADRLAEEQMKQAQEMVLTFWTVHFRPRPFILKLISYKL